MTRSTHRADIDGMRAVAIALVVGYHIGAPGLAGGFIGVDVFFVISGFLITRQLWAENETTRTIDVTGFWARRIRRLAPAATVMILAVLVAATLVASPLAWSEVSRAAVAASLSISNGYFGVQSADYFAAEVSSNPLLHTWSLAVEEQFYLVWPVLLLAVAGLGGTSVDQRRRRWTAAIVVVTLLSFGLGLFLTARGTPWAFYASPARAWEFGLGALAALVVPARLLTSDRRRTVMAGAGLALIVSALLLVDGSTAFPGAWALLPALGTALLMLAEAPVLVPALSLRPLQWIGRMSYGWYLWHWPILVLGIGYLGPVGLPTRTLLAAAALVPAMWSYRIVERPIRHSPPLARSPKTTFVLGGALVAVVIVGVALGGARIRDQLTDPGVQVLAAAQQDVSPLADESCESLDVEDLLESCLAVPPDGDRSDPILLVGDSHAGHWQPAVEEGAVALGRPLVTSWRGNCPAIPVAVRVDGRSSADCRTRQDGLLDMVDDLEPAAVVLSHSAAYDVSDEVWRQGLTELVIDLESRDIPVGVLLDIPRQDIDPVHCAAIHGLEAECTVDREAAEDQLADAHAREVDALIDTGHGAAFDPVPALCVDARCPLLVDDVVTYRDSNHLTATFAARLSPEIGRWLAAEVLP